MEDSLKDLYLLLGSEGALADRALSKLILELREERAEITTLFASEISLGEISDALSPSLFSERRALIIRDLQDLAEENRIEVTRYLESESPDSTLTLVMLHKGGVKGKALVEQIKKSGAEVIACEPLKRESDKEDFVSNLFLDLGRKAAPAAISALVNATGTEIGRAHV